MCACGCGAVPGAPSCPQATALTMPSTAQGAYSLATDAMRPTVVRGFAVFSCRWVTSCSTARLASSQSPASRTKKLSKDSKGLAIFPSTKKSPQYG